MKIILFPIGSSENAKNTLQYAINFATEINASVFVFRAFNVLSKAGSFVSADAMIERETNLYMRAIINATDRKKVAVKMITAKGTVLDSVTSVDKELGIDLIIMGPKSSSVKEEVFLGSTSGSMIKKTEIPVLVVPENYAFTPIKTILTAFKSGVINRGGILDPLKKVISSFNSESNLLLVKTPDHNEEDLVLNAELESIKDKFIVVENETTYQGVTNYSKSEKSDLLCVFRRKRGFFKKLWTKKTVLKEEFSSDIPLLILSGKN